MWKNMEEMFEDANTIIVTFIVNNTNERIKSFNFLKINKIKLIRQKYGRI